MPEATPLLEIRELTKQFGSRLHPVHAVSKVSLAIGKGETVGLVGESGSGKTTLGRMIVRLTDPTSGDIVYHGAKGPVNLATMSQRALRPLRSEIQIIFQDPYSSLNPRMRVRQILGEVLDTHGLAKGAARQPRILELLRQVGLAEEHAERFPHEFSGGQRQRIGIARALAANPTFIVADEPLSALDVSIQAQVINLLADIKDRLGLTMLFISHDLDVVEYLCDKVVVLYLGHVVEMAPAKTLFASPRHPYTQALLAASPAPDPTCQAEPVPLKGDIPSPVNLPSGCVFRTRCPQAEARCASADMHNLFEAATGHWHACWKSADNAASPAPPASALHGGLK